MAPAITATDKSLLGGQDTEVLPDTTPGVEAKGQDGDHVVEETRDLESGPLTVDDPQLSATSDVQRRDHVVEAPPVPRWIRRLKAANNVLFHHGMGIFLTIPLVIALVLVAQNKNWDREQCAARSVGCGFEGNEDAYGLGIRLGVYLQWLSWFLVTHLLPQEERGLMSNMTAFNTALLVAMLVLTFGRECTYSIEIIIILWIMAASTTLNALTKTGQEIEMLDHLEGSDEVPKTKKSVLDPSAGLVRANSFLVVQDRSGGMHGWTAATTIVEYHMLVYSIWFWIRLASGTDKTFAQTPCGTTLFMVGPVRSSGIPILSGFIAAAAFLLVLYKPIEYSLKQLSAERMSETLLTVLFFPMYILLVTVALVGALPTALIWIVFSRLWRWNDVDWEFLNLFQEENLTALFMSSIAFMVFLLTIIGIELSLVWNEVSGVYTVRSTGQLIPLSVGLVSAVPLLWKLTRTKLNGFGTSAPEDKPDKQE